MAGEFILINIAKGAVTSIANRVAGPLCDRVAPLCDPIGRSIRTMICDPIERSIRTMLCDPVCYPIGNSICNMYHFKSNVKKLKHEKKKLQQKKKGVEDDVENAKRQGKSIKEEVEEWLRVANEVAERIERIIDEGNLTWHTRYSDSMEAADLIEEVAELLVENFASRKLIFDDIMETLEKTGVKAIGLHGMGGVGKTTLAKQVYGQLTQERRLFDQVVMADVLQNPDRKLIQQVIADQLGLEFPEKEYADARAARLRERLKGKKVLVILDDVWQKLQLEDLGIPFGDTDDGHCRILVTSRDKRVCRSMKCEKCISVKPLYYDEAWNLFWNTVDDGEKKSKFRSIATKIVEKCDGLPVAILAIAGTLKDSDPSVWNKVSKELANFKGSTVVRDFHPVLKLSYDYLQNGEAKLLFLLFGLHRVGHPVLIDHLVRCVFGWGFLQSVTTLKDARDEVDQLIKELKNANLLLDSDREDMVKMHDVIHVVAQKIASREHNMFNIQDVVCLNKELGKGMYKDSIAMSLHHGEVHERLEKLDFPKLVLLLLSSEGRYEGGHRYRSYLEIPDTFLGGMEELRVLVLNGICLWSFIPSLNYESLQTLSLEYCNVKDIRKVGMLKKLEVLTFSGPNVKRLPKEIGDLTCLKLLDLKHCSKLKVIPRNVISKLTQLGELYMCYGFVNWDTRRNVSLTELKQLHHLTILHMHIMDATIIPQDFFPQKLERFKIVIDNFYKAGESCKSSMEKISRKNWFNKFDEEAEDWFNKFDEEAADRFNKFDEEAEDWFNKFDEAGKQFGERKMFLKSANYLHCGVEKFLQKTEVLFIRDLDHLEKLYHGDSREEPSTMLKVIDVQSCAALTQLISSSMTRLEEIKVTECENLIEIAGNDVPDDDITISKIVFAELRTLTLKRLPRLMNFGPTTISRTFENIQGGDHEDLKSLFDNKVSFPSLKNLALYYLNIPKIWCDQLPSPYSFGETLTSLVVEGCNHLKFLFSSSMVNGLQQLEKLGVYGCESMEVIINKEEVCDSLKERFDEGSSSVEDNMICRIIFPKLTHLVLYRLSKLKSFYNGLHISYWPSLKKLEVKFCDEVEVFGSEFQSLCEENRSVQQPLFIVDKAAFPRLEELQLWDNNNMKEIWHGGGIFSKTLSFSGKTNIIKFPHYLLATDRLDIPYGYFKQIGGGSDDSFADALIHLRDLTVHCSVDLCFRSSYSLACLVSSWVSFQNLKSLRITNCDSGFRYLLTYSTATSLQHLIRLEISDCEKIEVIIMPPTDEANEKIVFRQLKYLELWKLESLTSFYSSSHTLEFPSLEKMIVNRCPNMKVFSEGDLITTVLQRVQLQTYNDDKWRWEGDLNNTIQKMFEDMNVQSQEED